MFFETAQQIAQSASNVFNRARAITVKPYAPSGAFITSRPLYYIEVATGKYLPTQHEGDVEETVAIYSPQQFAKLAEKKRKEDVTAHLFYSNF